MAVAKIRLHLAQPLGHGQSVTLTEAQAHYLFAVMRQAAGAQVLVFNGRDGEWLAEVSEAGKRGGRLACLAQTRPQVPVADLWLVFAPLKKARTDFVVEKAVELGVAAIRPVQTEFTNAERVRADRLAAIATEAAEQCGALSVPEVCDLVSLDRLLSDWDPTRRILWADEACAGPASLLAGAAPGPWAVLIGPEGGFSDRERRWLAELPFVTAVSLGPRILRAETAAVAALVLWQAALGDWR